MSELVLHGYWRSGASYRVRIGLNLKNLAYRHEGVDLRAGDQSQPAFTELNPQGLAPALVTSAGVLTQSPAILEWLEETHPHPPLLPKAAFARAEVRAMAALIGCDVQPLQNLRVLKALRSDHGLAEEAVQAWARRWITAGFDALERLIERRGGAYAFEDGLTFADVYLAPQVYSARRFGLDLGSWPRLLAAAERAAMHPAFVQAHPDTQPDADRPAA